MALEIANPIPASGALPRTRSMKKNYASLAEGPISSQLLRDVATETRKRRASASSSDDDLEPLVKKPCCRPRKNPLSPTVPSPSDLPEGMGICSRFLMGVAAETRKGRSSAAASTNSTQLPAKRRPGRPRKAPLPPTVPAPSNTSEDVRITPPLLTDAAAAQTRKGRASSPPSGDCIEPLAKKRCGGLGKNPVTPTVPPTSNTDVPISPHFVMGVTAETCKGRAGSTSSGKCTKALPKRRPGRPSKKPLQQASAPPSTTSSNMRVRTPLLKAVVAADVRMMRASAAAITDASEDSMTRLDTPTVAPLAEEQEWADAFESFLSSVSADSSQPGSPGGSSVNGRLDTHMSDLVDFNLSGEPVEDSSSSEEVAGLLLAVAEQGRLELTRQARAAQKRKTLGVKEGGAKKCHGRRRRS